MRLVDFSCLFKNCSRVKIRVLRELFDLFPAFKDFVQVAKIGPDRRQAGPLENGLDAAMLLDDLRVEQQVMHEMVQVAAVQIGQKCQVLDAARETEAGEL